MHVILHFNHISIDLHLLSKAVIARWALLVACRSSLIKQSHLTSCTQDFAPVFRAGCIENVLCERMRWLNLSWHRGFRNDHLRAAQENLHLGALWACAALVTPFCFFNQKPSAFMPGVNPAVTSRAAPTFNTRPKRRRLAGHQSKSAMGTRRLHFDYWYIQKTMAPK